MHKKQWLLASVFALNLGLVGSAWAQAQVKIEDPWARATVPGVILSCHANSRTGKSRVPGSNRPSEIASRRIRAMVRYFGPAPSSNAARTAVENRSGACITISSVTRFSPNRLAACWRCNSSCAACTLARVSARTWARSCTTRSTASRTPASGCWLPPCWVPCWKVRRPSCNGWRQVSRCDRKDRAGRPARTPFPPRRARARHPRGGNTSGPAKPVPP